MARSVADAALMLTVCQGFDARDPMSLEDTDADYLSEMAKDIGGWRIGWSADLGFATVDPEISAICAASLKVFEGLGANVDDAGLEYADPEEAMWHGLWLPIYGDFANYAASEVAEGLDPQLQELLAEARTLNAPQIGAASGFRSAMWKQTVAWFEHFDLLVCPTLCVEPFPNGQFCPSALSATPLRTQLLGWLLTYPFNMMSALPVASIPCGFTANGLPVGLQIVGRPRCDAAVLRAAANFERAAPWPLVPTGLVSD